MTLANRPADLDRKLAYAVFRLSLGINILMHGAGRIFGPGVGAFASKTATLLAGTILPAGLVNAFLIVLPFAEFILGVLIAGGLWTRWAFNGFSLDALVVRRA